MHKTIIAGLALGLITSFVSTAFAVELAPYKVVCHVVKYYDGEGNVSHTEKTCRPVALKGVQCVSSGNGCASVEEDGDTLVVTIVPNGAML